MKIQLRATHFKLTSLLAAGFTLLLSLSALAQTATVVRRADLAIPFSVAQGKLVLVSDYLVFVDDLQPEHSFTLMRSDIKSFKTEGDQILIETLKPVYDRSGERTNLSFRLRDGSSDPFVVWHAVQSVTPAPAEKETWTYQAKHLHRVALVPSGSCVGKLIINQNRVVYESLENREHTRQWLLSGIKQIKRTSPYKFEVEPFTGDTYSLEFEGNGMDITVFKKLQDWIVQSRVKG